MRSLRRRLASCALALSLLQCAVVFAAPLAACCRSAQPETATSSVAGSVQEHECCPAGAHPAGECPLHRTKTASRSSDAANQCRMRCDARHAPEFVLGAAGLLPAPAVVLAPAAPALFDLRISPDPEPYDSLTDPPPPRRL